MKHPTVVFAVAAAALLISACDKAPNIAGPQKAPAGQPAFSAIVDQTNERDVPWAAVEPDPCTGDMVTIQGSTHFLYHFVVDGTGGGYHLSTRSNSRGTGVGAPSTFTYRVMDLFTYMEQNPEGPQFTIRQEEQVLILPSRSNRSKSKVSPNPADKYIRHMIFKLTYNANGVPATEFERSWTKCVG